MVGTLYVVATPIGNLEDITLRALRVLQEVALIAAEDTRHTRKLLARYTIETPMLSFHKHSPPARLRELLQRLEAGESIALVTDAGTPGISDPGAALVKAALESGIPVVPVPGPSAITAALSVSGFPAQRFRFEGFPPRKEGARTRFFEALQAEDAPIVLFESPYRLLKTLQTAHTVLGNRPVTVCREMTKQFEQIFHGTLGEAVAHYQQHAPRGEFVIIIGAPKQE